MDGRTTAGRAPKVKEIRLCGPSWNGTQESLVALPGFGPTRRPFVAFALLRALCGAAHFPRFRTLSFFRRRPHERVAHSSMPASENLHISRRGGLLVAPSHLEISPHQHAGSTHATLHR